MTRHHEVAVVVVTYNGTPWIKACLESVVCADDSVQVIVVDNASTDGTASVVRDHFPTVEVIASTENLGFGIGNNLGISKALRDGARYVLLLNQDAFMTPGSLSALCSHMDRNPQVGICSPMQCSPDADHIDPGTYRYYMAEHGVDLLRDSIQGTLKESYRTPGLNAAVWLVRAETFLRVGGFDPLFFMYGEDDDWLHRMQHHDVWFSLLPAVVAVHLRQSPPGPKSGWAGRFKRRVNRSRASLLGVVKKPGYSAAYTAALILARGIVHPLGDLVIDRRFESFLAMWLAALQLAAEFPAIRRHVALSRQPGAHFLDLPAGFGLNAGPERARLTTS